MGRIARESIQRAGIDVDALIEKLEAATRAKLASYYHYTILSAGSAGIADEGLREVLRDVRTEHLNHFDALVTRIYELDGRLPTKISHFATAQASSDDLPIDPGHGTPDLVTALIGSGRQMMLTSTHLCDVTRGKDHRTYELALAILTEEAEHEAWFHELLGTGPQPRFHRGFRGRSPTLAHLPSNDLDSS